MISTSDEYLVKHSVRC